MAVTMFEAFLKRIFEATGIRSQTELAATLQINRSAITQASAGPISLAEPTINFPAPGVRSR